MSLNIYVMNVDEGLEATGLTSPTTECFIAAITQSAPCVTSAGKFSPSTVNFRSTWKHTPLSNHSNVKSVVKLTSMKITSNYIIVYLGQCDWSLCDVDLMGPWHTFSYVNALFADVWHLLMWCVFNRFGFVRYWLGYLHDFGYIRLDRWTGVHVK